MKCIFPSKALLIAFNEFCHPIYKKIETNSNENKIILNLRETLLPKLISGEIKIPDAENLIEEAGI
jgi:type I restriction enzyme S subunit